MASIVQLFAMAMVMTTAYGETINVTSSVQDYMRISQNELLHEIEIVELQIASIDDRYADRLDVIQIQQQQVLSEIQQVNRTLMPLQALNLIRKHCIQKYDSQLITYDNAKSQLKTCYDKAVVAGNSLTSNASTNIVFARNNVLITLPRNAAACHNSSGNNQTALESCYMTQVNVSTVRVNNNLDKARDQMDSSLYDASVQSKTAVKCSFAVEKVSLEAIGQASAQINDCEVNWNKSNGTAVLSSAGSLIAGH